MLKPRQHENSRNIAGGPLGILTSPFPAVHWGVQPENPSFGNPESPIWKSRISHLEIQNLPSGNPYFFVTDREAAFQPTCLKLCTRGLSAPLQISLKWVSSVMIHHHLWFSSFYHLYIPWAAQSNDFHPFNLAEFLSGASIHLRSRSHVVGNSLSPFCTNICSLFLHK